MNPKHSKLQHQQQERQAAELHQTADAASERAFESVEQMLREDAATVRVPPAVENRLSRSAQQNPRSPRSWWTRRRKG
jgi:hypothetical protein